MSYLIDTNILLRSVQATHPMHNQAVDAVRLLFDQEEELCILPQNLIEYWAVATRPVEANGLGWSVAETRNELAQLKQMFTLKPDTPDTFSIWERLVDHHQVMGKKVHDTRLVAGMISHRIRYLLTFNTDDFTRFSEITVVSPQSIVSSL